MLLLFPIHVVNIPRYLFSAGMKSSSFTTIGTQAASQLKCCLKLFLLFS